MSNLVFAQPREKPPHNFYFPTKVKKLSVILKIQLKMKNTYSTSLKNNGEKRSASMTSKSTGPNKQQRVSLHPKATPPSKNGIFSSFNCGTQGLASDTFDFIVNSLSFNQEDLRSFNCVDEKMAEFRRMSRHKRKKNKNNRVVSDDENGFSDDSIGYLSSSGTFETISVMSRQSQASSCSNRYRSGRKHNTVTPSSSIDDASEQCTETQSTVPHQRRVESINYNRVPRPPLHNMKSGPRFHMNEYGDLSEQSPSINISQSCSTLGSQSRSQHTTNSSAPPRRYYRNDSFSGSNIGASRRMPYPYANAPCESLNIGLSTSTITTETANSFYGAGGFDANGVTNGTFLSSEIATPPRHNLYKYRGPSFPLNQSVHGIARSDSSSARSISSNSYEGHEVVSGCMIPNRNSQSFVTAGPSNPSSFHDDGWRQNNGMNLKSLEHPMMQYNGINVKEVNLPPGKTGLTLKSSRKGPLILAVSSKSVSSALQAGDTILSLDGEDVSLRMTHIYSLH